MNMGIPPDEWTARLRAMVDALGTTPEIPNLYATQAGQREIAAQLNKFLDDIDADRKERGSIWAPFGSAKRREKICSSGPTRMSKILP